jgi:hypothetical protein
MKKGQDAASGLACRSHLLSAGAGSCSTSLVRADQCVQGVLERDNTSGSKNNTLAAILCKKRFSHETKEKV